MQLHNVAGTIHLIATHPHERELITRFFITHDKAADDTDAPLIALKVESRPLETYKNGNGRKKYKRQVPQTCPQCGKAVKGNIGLALHSARMHRLMTREALDAASAA